MKNIVLASAVILTVFGSSSTVKADKTVPDSETEDFQSVQNGSLFERDRSFYSERPMIYERPKGALQPASSSVSRQNVPDSESAAWRSVVGIPGGY